MIVRRASFIAGRFRVKNIKVTDRMIQSRRELDESARRLDEARQSIRDTDVILLRLASAVNRVEPSIETILIEIRLRDRLAE